eukprot:CAMPEP_0173358742 /NCGR_PEP_ID=MMETSP1144-20121109/19626_1 /TAXON_ID=483371 /ORGANISM="non described non described, Strain CCMP2298" /LENGTH=230 /DNA_ID=CAMNT_0014307869 /DNA_START=243 /DNA_END=932 /DNA_ORIENTATION=-
MSSTEKAKESVPEPESSNSTESAVVQHDYDEYDDYEEPKTAGQKVKVYGALAARLLLLGLGVVCVFFTGRELFPGRMSPNSLFSETFDLLRYNEQIMSMAGEGMKAFGRDVGRSEGRRNQIDSYQYKADDGSNRTRVRFNIKGSKSKVVVWAEISDAMASNEFVFVVCQNARTGQVVTIQDHRDRLEEEQDSNTDPSGSLINKFFFSNTDPSGSLINKFFFSNTDPSGSL